MSLGSSLQCGELISLPIDIEGDGGPFAQETRFPQAEFPGESAQWVEGS